MKSFLLIILTALCGSMVPSVSKISLEVVAPVSALYIRMLLSAILFTILFHVLHRPYSLNVFRHTWKMSFLLVINFACMFFSLNYIPSALVPIVYATSPLFTILLQKLLKSSERITTMKIIGILMGFVGVIITSVGVNRFGVLSTHTIIGVGSILVGSLSFSLYTILSKKHQQRFDPLHITYTVTLLVTVLLLPLFIVEYVQHPYLALLAPRHFASFSTTAIIGTVLFYSLLQYSIKHSDSSTASLFSYIQPVFAVALSILLVGESITVLFVIGAIITLAGAYIASKR